MLSNTGRVWIITRKMSKLFHSIAEKFEILLCRIPFLLDHWEHYVFERQHGRSSIIST